MTPAKGFKKGKQQERSKTKYKTGVPFLALYISSAAGTEDECIKETSEKVWKKTLSSINKEHEYVKKKKQKNKIRRSGNKPSKSRGQGVSLKHDLRGFIEILNSVVL